MPKYISQANMDLVTKRNIFTKEEFLARYEIHQQAYKKIIHIEAKTSIDMVLHQILPAATAYTTALCNGITAKKAVGASCKAETALVHKLSQATDALYEATEKLNTALDLVPENLDSAVAFYADVVVAHMNEMRIHADILEQLTDKNYWSYPSYSDLLYY